VSLQVRLSAPPSLQLATGNVVTNPPAVDSGLAVLEVGGDFADGASYTKATGCAARPLYRSTRRQ
jgi:hypothetical protein